jgi:hypothetical protein
MSKSFYTEWPKHSFSENVAAALVGKENYPVELVDADTQKIQILASGILIGTISERLEGSSAYLVHTRGPIRKCIAGGAINAPAYVKMGATGVVAASSGDKCCGIAINPKTIATGDIVSFIQTDCVMP